MNSFLLLQVSLASETKRSKKKGTVPIVLFFIPLFLCRIRDLTKKLGSRIQNKIFFSDQGPV
jgi:hypothetical protein